jgi:hypothetical protein
MLLKLLKNYFVEVERLANDLCKQIFYVCSRAIEVVQSQDNALQQLVSAIRIIEREERLSNINKIKWIFVVTFVSDF